ncbi:MAG: hypothetical protein FJX66_12660 [Alphaproteobacteria bacterium]|nr:hypothetical protein [Alphaproteobacteria bacterium]
MTDIVERFTVDQPPDAVWAFFQDVPAVVTCIPGLALTGEEPPDKYRGKIRLRLGPVSAAFEGEAMIVERDATARRARIEGQGLDRQGGSRASARVDYQIAPKDAGSEVTVTAEIKLTGALAQIGRTGIVQDVARELTAVFASTLRERLAASAAAAASAPIAASSLTAPSIEASSSSAAAPLPTTPLTASGRLAPPAAQAPALGLGFFLRVLWRRLLGALGVR